MRLSALIFRLLVAVVAALTISGCGSSEAAGGVTTIRYMAWGNPEQIQTERDIVAAFEELHPKIRVKLFMVPGSSYADKLQLMLASRTAPDVMRADHYYFASLARKGYFLPLDGLIAQEKPGFLSDYVPLALEEGKWQGRLYGMNVLFGGIMIYYNKKLFHEAGLPDPYELDRQGRWTWDAFRDAAVKLTRRKDGRAEQFGTDMLTFPQYAAVVWNQGGKILDPVRDRIVVQDDPAAVRGVQDYVDLRWKYHCAPTPSENALSPFSFESGKLGMHWGWAGESPRYRKAAKDFEWDIVPTPSGPRGNRTVIKGNQLVLFRESRHPREAWEFMKYMTGPEAEMLLDGKLRRCVPTRLSVQHDPEYLKADQPPFHTDVFLKTVERGRTLPIDARYQEWIQEFNSAMDPLMNGQTGDAKAVLTEAAARANRVLAGEEGF